MSVAKDFLKKVDLSKLDENTAQVIRELMKDEAFKFIELSDDLDEFKKVKEIIESEFPEAIGLPKRPLPTVKIEPEITVQEDEEVEVDDDEKLSDIEVQMKDIDEQMLVVNMLLEDDKDNQDLKEQKSVLEILIDDIKSNLESSKSTAKKKVGKKELGGFLLGAGLGFVTGSIVKIKLPDEPKIIYVGKKKYEDGGDLHHINMSWESSLPLLLQAYKENPSIYTDEFISMAKAADNLYAHSISSKEDTFFQENIMKYVPKASENSEEDYTILEAISELADKYNEGVDNPDVFKDKFPAKFFIVARQRGKILEYNKGGSTYN